MLVAFDLKASIKEERRVQIRIHLEEQKAANEGQNNESVSAIESNTDTSNS